MAEGTTRGSPPTLETAWNEAEAALPDGWQFMVQRLDFDGPWEAFAKSRHFWEDGNDVEFEIGEGPTPALALQDLAASLRDTAP